MFIAEKSRLTSNTTIGGGTRIKEGVIIKGAGNCEITKYCAIGKDVNIIFSNHDMSKINLQYALQKRIGLKISRISEGLVIVNNVWMGDLSLSKQELILVTGQFCLRAQ